MSNSEYAPPECLHKGMALVFAAINEASRMNEGNAFEPTLCVLGRLLYEMGRRTAAADAVEMRKLLIRLCGEAFDDGQLNLTRRLQ